MAATVSLSIASNKEIIWTSSNSNVANVLHYGVVQTKAFGTATITVTAADGKMTAAYTITVRRGTDFSAWVLEILKQLLASISPSNDMNKNIS